jgi:hypothetical protein
MYKMSASKRRTWVRVPTGDILPVGAFPKRDLSRWGALIPILTVGHVQTACTACAAKVEDWASPGAATANLMENRARGQPQNNHFRHGGCDRILPIWGFGGWLDATGVRPSRSPDFDELRRGTGLTMRPGRHKTCAETLSNGMKIGHEYADRPQVLEPCPAPATPASLRTSCSMATGARAWPVFVA